MGGARRAAGGGGSRHARDQCSGRIPGKVADRHSRAHGRLPGGEAALHMPIEGSKGLPNEVLQGS